MVGAEHVRDFLYAGPGEVFSELGAHSQHLLRCYCGAGNMEIHNKGENSK